MLPTFLSNFLAWDSKTGYLNMLNFHGYYNTITKDLLTKITDEYYHQGKVPYLVVFHHVCNYESIFIIWLVLSSKYYHIPGYISEGHFEQRVWYN